MSRRIDPKNLGAYEKRVAKMLASGVDGALRRAGAKGVALLARKSAKIEWRGRFKTGWMYQARSSTLRFFNKTRHWIFVEKGRKPGLPMPPVRAIRRWVLDHGMHANAAFPIARSIGIRGIKARPVLTAPANVKALQNIVKTELSSFVRNVLRTA